MNDNIQHDPHYEHEARCKIQLANEIENADIIRRFNAAIEDATNDWLIKKGGKVSMFETIKAQLIKKGLVKYE
jgi:hypothetical protein